MSDQRILDLVSAVSNQDGVLEDPTSPQSRARDWLLTNTNRAIYSNHRLLQRYAMATFYYATNGDRSWLNNTGWLSDDDECTTWHQITPEPTVCDDAGQLVYLRPSVFLDGTLPPETALLSKLRTVLLPGNLLRGPIPSALAARLTDLRLLNVFGNDLSGTIPTEWGAGGNLTSLDLSTR